MPKGMSVKEALEWIAKEHPEAKGVDLAKLPADVQKAMKKAKRRGRTKFNTSRVKIPVDGYEFDSLAEANRYRELKRLVRMGKIFALVPHPTFLLIVRDKKVCSYTADFQYHVPAPTPEGFRVVVEDVKNPITAKLAAFRLKWRLMDACHDIQVVILVR